MRSDRPRRRSPETLPPVPRGLQTLALLARCLAAPAAVSGVQPRECATPAERRLLEAIAALPEGAAGDLAWCQLEEEGDLAAADLAAWLLLAPPALADYGAALLTARREAAPAVHWLGACEAWRRRLLAGTLGEEPANHFTWVMDPLYRASVLERTAREEWAQGWYAEARRTLARATALLAEHHAELPPAAVEAQPA